MSPAGAAVVTGGASGIGEAVARRLAADGAAVAVLDRDAEGAARVASDIGGLALVADVGDSAALEEALERAAEQLGGLRWLVNNAGVGNLKPLEDYSDREVDLIWRVNVAGTFSGLRAAARLMRPGGGSIVNIASVSGVRPTRGEAPYSAAKAAVVALTQAAALGAGPGDPRQLRVARVRAHAVERGARVRRRVARHHRGGHAVGPGGSRRTRSRSSWRSCSRTGPGT